MNNNMKEIKYEDTEVFNKTFFLEEKGINLYKEITKLNLEGIVAKKKNSLYHIGKRSDVWLKIKNIKEGEFVVGGYIINKNTISLLLGELKDVKEYSILSSLLLRSMQKAVYDKNNIGHFGLGSKCYTHFTSPIRRYPDLMVHRLLRKYLFNNQINEEVIEYYEKQLEEITSHSSERERAAVDCEREVDDMKKAEYMASFIGNLYEGVVTSIHKFGIFVTLPNTVDGLIRKDNLYLNGFNFDQYSNVYVNINGRKITLGETVKVRLINSNKKTSEIDFELVYNNKGVSRYGKYKGYRKK